MSLTVNPGAVTPVHFEVIASGNAQFSGSASASADPHIFIAPSNANAASYGIVVSENVGNDELAVTPLPAAFPLFATGLGALSLFGWRRKKKAAAFAA